jgi:hypothetical protein
VTTLKDILCTDPNRPNVIDDAARLVDEEVKAKGGISGLAIKAGYKAVTAIKPTIIKEAVDGLLDRFAEKLDPFYTSWEGAGKTPAFDQYLMARKSEVGNALLSVTDDRAKKVDNKTIKKAYDSLRPQAEKHVLEAMPNVARMMAKYVR